MRVRRLILMMLVAGAVVCFVRCWQRHRDAIIEDEAARSNWENEGGAPDPVDV